MNFIWEFPYKESKNEHRNINLSTVEVGLEERGYMKQVSLLHRIFGTAYLVVVFGISIFLWTSSDFAEVAHLVPPAATEGFSFAWNPLKNSSHGCSTDPKTKFNWKQGCSLPDSQAQQSVSPSSPHSLD